MHDVKEKLEDICEMKKRLIKMVEHELDKGSEAIDAQELGEVVDMIKDLADVEKMCYEACYYKSVVEAMDEFEDYPMMNDRMGYPRGRNAMGQFTSGRGRSNRRSGYEPDRDRTNDDMSQRSGYDPGWRMNEPHMRPGESDGEWDGQYGRPFNRFRKAKRHYTQTHSEKDREKMREHADEHLMQVMATTKEMYRSSDPDVRKRMKADLTKFVNDLEA